jgi:hypothetical protein
MSFLQVYDNCLRELIFNSWSVEPLAIRAKVQERKCRDSAASSSSLFSAQPA